ncbi:MAG: DUF1365 domain-containing protein [Candidatus Saccharibacteria bacterium]|nr:DUF1365 domain-containing protein [Moraxellaceae bacterium]
MLPIISLAHAQIRHRRYTPKTHAFEYQMGYVLVDIDRISEACGRSPFWSYNRFNFISLYDKDLLASAQNSIRDSLRHAIQQQLGETISDTQPIYALTLPSYLGLSFNPVSFYWVYDAHQPTLKFIAAHITNTPWHERFLYCFSCEPSEQTFLSPQKEGPKHPPVYRFLFDKQFHVSPFMPMQLKYDWRFKLDPTDDPSHSAIHMQLKQQGKLVFDATMQFTLQPLPTWKQHLFPLIYPLQSIKIVWAIYWQALRIFLKGIPFFSHPAVSK